LQVNDDDSDGYWADSDDDVDDVGDALNNPGTTGDRLFNHEANQQEPAPDTVVVSVPTTTTTTTKVPNESHNDYDYDYDDDDYVAPGQEWDDDVF